MLLSFDAQLAVGLDLDTVAFKQEELEAKEGDAVSAAAIQRRDVNQ